MICIVVEIINGKKRFYRYSNWETAANYWDVFHNPILRG